MNDKILIYWGLGIVIGILAIIEVLFDPLSWVINLNRVAAISAELPAAKARWQAQAIENYTVDVKGSLANTCYINATLTVRGGQIERIVKSEEPTILDFCTSEGRSTLLVLGLYRRIEADLGRGDWYGNKLQVTFDAEYGYIQKYRYESCYQRGLLSPICSESIVGDFRFSNFKPETESSSH